MGPRVHTPLTLGMSKDGMGRTGWKGSMKESADGSTGSPPTDSPALCNRLGCCPEGSWPSDDQIAAHPGASAPLAGTTSASSREIDGATSRGFLNRAFGGQAQNHAAIVLAAQLHYQPVSVGHRLRVAVEALQGYRVEEGMAAAEIEQPVDGLEA